ncbi:interleukin-7 receptor subunit alpha [Anolis carolinensis]|uniref:interleukin-7 receptor subunit alpha n=1 Tax=Anolis carolinensis TaxID=28377 RepID=UPI002F2B40A7
MRRTRQMLYTYCLVLLPVISAENGFEASADPDTCTDAELDSSFDCIVQMPRHLENYLICKVTAMELFLNEADIRFTVNAKDKCKTDSQLVMNYSMEASELHSPIQVCLEMNQQCRDCKKVTGIKIIKPEAPFNLKITYLEKANEYLVDFSSRHGPKTYLSGKLMHELAYRQESTPWTNIESQYTPLKILGKKLQPGSRYEMRVRSKPHGGYFEGTWSEWSSSEYQKTPDQTYDNTTIVVMGSILIFLLLFLLISLIQIFWKSRIKPIVWPTLPTHEEALEKLCKKLRKHSDASFFNPENLGYVDIHKVDSLQAKPKLDDFQPSFLPWDAANPEKFGDELDPKNNLVLLNDGWLKLPLAYEGMWPAEMLNRCLGGKNPATGGNSFINGDNSAGSSGSSSDALSSCSTASMGTIMLFGSEADPCHHTYTNSEVRVPNIEEAYVTMASFVGNKGNEQCQHLAWQGPRRVIAQIPARSND